MLGFIVSRAKWYSDELLLFCNIILLLLVFTTFFCVPIIFIKKSLTREFLFVSIENNGANLVSKRFLPISLSGLFKLSITGTFLTEYKNVGREWTSLLPLYRDSKYFFRACFAKIIFNLDPLDFTKYTLLSQVKSVIHVNVYVVIWIFKST